tara:strand:- start:203 stop:838 length:636 start_codon:yes stop_codon:yes gene_type:complete
MKETNLIESLVKAQSEMTHAQLDQINPQWKSKFASLKSVIDAVKPALNNNGIFFMQISHPVDAGVGIETVFCKGDEKLSTGVVVVPVDKLNAQGLGSSMTYAKRYSLAVACGISASEDDDGNAAAANPPPPNSTGRKPQSVTRQVIEQEGIVVDEPKRDAYVTQLMAKVTDADTGGVQELVDELSTDSDMKIAVWAELPSPVRSFIKKLGK